MIEFYKTHQITIELMKQFKKRLYFVECLVNCVIYLKKISKECIVHLAICIILRNNKLIDGFYFLFFILL